MLFGAADGDNDQHQQTTGVLVLTLGSTYNEFGYYEHPDFLCIKIIDSNAKKFRYKEHPPKRTVPFAFFDSL